jgi:hypothetical protein
MLAVRVMSSLALSVPQGVWRGYVKGDVSALLYWGACKAGGEPVQYTQVIGGARLQCASLVFIYYLERWAATANSLSARDRNVTHPVRGSVLRGSRQSCGALVAHTAALHRC